MQDDTNQRTTPSPPDRNAPLKLDRVAAANIIRTDLDRIYQGEDAPFAVEEKELHTKTSEAVAREIRAQQKPAQQKDTGDVGVHTKVSEDWKQYHTSWQSYYQQYYERYYLHHLNQATLAIAQEPTPTKKILGSDDGEETAVNELRNQLLTTVKERAVTVKKSRHFAPIATAMVFAFVFLFLQYNRLLFASVQAYVSPGAIDSQNIIVDPSAGLKVGPEPKLIIPKINIEAPTVYGVNPADVNAVENKLRDGVVHYPIANAASSPGQNGATVILGHSSNDVFDNGGFKFVFVQLSKLETGDTFYIHHQGTRYTYAVTKKEIIDPKDVGKVTGDPTKPSAILITCDPPGTALRRLLVFADQVSPDPAASQKAPASTASNNQDKEIVGNGPTLIERLFGAQ